MVTGGEVELDVYGLSKRAEQMEYEFQTLIRGDVGGNSMFGKDME